MVQTLEPEIFEGCGLDNVEVAPANVICLGPKSDAVSSS